MNNNFFRAKCWQAVDFFLSYSETVLNITPGIDTLGNLEYPLVISLLLAWVIVFAALSKGVASLGKISYFTATFPYVTELLFRNKRRAKLNFLSFI